MDDQAQDAPLPQISISFGRLARAGWFEDAYHSSMLVRFTTTVGLSVEALRAQYQFPLILPFQRPVAIGVMSATGGKLPVTETLLYGGQDGALNIHFSQREIDVPQSTLLILRTPIQIDGFDSGHAAASERLDAAAGLLAMYAGRNLIRGLLFEGVLSGETDGWQVRGAAVRIPSPIEGPYIATGLWQRLEEAAAVSFSSGVAEEDRERVVRALEFIGRAINSAESFLFYWTALEVLCGTAGKIRADLCQAYGLTKQQHVDHVTGFGVISRLRHDMVHFGRRVTLTAELERYIQLLLIDLVEFKLGMNQQWHALAFQSLDDAPLAQLGIDVDWARLMPAR